HAAPRRTVTDDPPPGVDLLPLSRDGDPHLHLLAVRGVGGAPEDSPGAEVSAGFLVRLGRYGTAAEEGKRNPRTLSPVVRATCGHGMLGGSIHTGGSLHGRRTAEEGESARTTEKVGRMPTD